MSATFTMPGGDDKDRIRALVGDTSVKPESAAQITDEQIYLQLDLAGNSDPTVTRCSRRQLYRAAAGTAEAIAAAYANQVTNSVGGAQAVREQASDRYAHYVALAASLLARSAKAGVGGFYGGASVSGKLAARQDPDKTPAYFTREQMREPGTSPLDPFGEFEVP